MPVTETARAERAAWLRLVLAPGVGPVAARDLLAAFGLPEDVLAAGRAALARVVGERLASQIVAADPQREDAIARALDWADAPGHHVLTIADAGYPARLLQIGDPPPLVFVRGSPEALSRPMLAIVGSRSASRGGVETAEAFAAALARAGLTIVSGLALGVDAAAHRGALATAAGTVAVLGTGVDLPYPDANRSLAEAVVAHGGALISELPLGTGPRSANFPRRNRLIAGLSLGVLVVEAALRSGSLITARQAGEFGREVFAIPGSIHSPLSKGCHQLIRQGAKLVESAQDVLGELPEFAARAHGHAARRGRGAARTGAPAGAGGDPHADPVLRAMGWDPISAEALAGRLTGLEGGAGALAGRLLALELDGRVERLADGRYQRLGDR